MNRHLSVLALHARKTLKKVLLLAALMAASEGIMFYSAVKSESHLSLERAIEGSGFLSAVMAYRVFFVLTCVVLVFYGCDIYGSKSDYSIRRLSVKESTYYIWQAVYNTACLLFLWAAQLMVVIVMCCVFVKLAEPASVNDQTIFLAFYRSGFMHGMLPLAEVSAYVSRIVICICVGVCAVCYNIRQRREEKGIAVFILAIIASAGCSTETGSLASDVVIIIFNLVITVTAVVGIY